MRICISKTICIANNLIKGYKKAGYKYESKIRYIRESECGV